MAPMSLEEQKRLVLKALKDLANQRVIQGYRKFCPPVRRGRALLSYLVHPFLTPKFLAARYLYSGNALGPEMARALNELGYEVDIIHALNLRFRPQREYGLFVGHGGTNFSSIARMLGPTKTKIYFSTGLYWKEWNRREASRLGDFAARTGWLLPPERGITADEESANTIADTIICLGNQAAAETYAQFSSVHPINNACLPIQWVGWKGKDFAAGRKHFLFFSGRGNIHKGLDRVLEGFAGTGLHLHVCQHIEPSFASACAKHLIGNPFVSVHNFVNQRSSAFYELARLCNWVITASCAEGQPGAVLEAMGHGLIPILPATANIDMGGWGLHLPDCEIGTIRETVLRASAMDAEHCRLMAVTAVEEIRSRYTTEAFRSGFQAIVAGVVGGDVPGAPDSASRELPKRDRLGAAGEARVDGHTAERARRVPEEGSRQLARPGKVHAAASRGQRP